MYYKVLNILLFKTL